MTEHAKTKWAMPEPRPEPVTNLDAIDISDEALLQQAMIDFVSEFAGFVVHGKSTTEAIAALDCWRGWLETVREHSK